MRALVVYSSRTGNTKKVAGAVYEVMPEGAEIYHVDEAPDPNGYDFVALGYWVDRTTADKAARDYIKRIRGKKVGIFGTLGAPPDSDHAKESRSNVKELIHSSNEVVVDFLCRGKVAPEIIQFLRNLPKDNPYRMDDERLEGQIEAEKHPDERDLDMARKAFEDVIG